MNRLTLLATTAGLLLLGAGCQAYQAQGYPVGVIYTGTKAPSAMDRANVSGKEMKGSKSGESCATGILALVAFGDASLDAAKKKGGITDVHSVEYSVTNVVGPVYVQACTIVHGE